MKSSTLLLCILMWEGGHLFHVKSAEIEILYNNIFRYSVNERPVGPRLLSHILLRHCSLRPFDFFLVTPICLPLRGGYSANYEGNSPMELDNDGPVHSGD
jgi:hypothetical protein